ncbi:MAG: putative peptidoglycan glycosyltransferase FtsW [Filomicrobium sp.]
MSISRSDRSRLAEWWFTVDHVLIVAIAVLMLSGIVLSLAASPAVAVKKELPTFFFFERHIVFSLAGFVVMMGLSFCSPVVVRRFALLLLLVSSAALVWVLLSNNVINGARRWISIGGISLQPSEFVKPAFVVVVAWLFAEARNRQDMPGLPLAVGVGAIVCGLVVMQPDVGQTALLVATWGALYLLAGLPFIGVAVLGGVGVFGVIAAYLFFPHVQSRIDRFVSASHEANSQVSRAIDSFVQGGFLGRGPGEGTIKTRFPDAHTDFIFSVIAEEYGAVACLGLVALFAFIVVKAMISALRELSLANRLAVQGLAIMFGGQAFINMGVNVGLLPATGMTLPYISAGGSSMLAVSVGLGMLLALSRRRVGLDGFEMAKYSAAPAVMGEVNAYSRHGQV